MDKKLQQRLIGAVVLVTLGVVFIPMILDGSGFRERTQRRIEIPPEPEYPPLHEVELKAIEPTHVVEQKKKPAPENPKPEAKEPPRPAPVTRPEPLKAPLKSLALQVATLSSKDSAYKLRDDLRKDGYSAYVESETRKGKTSYRVRIGPELDRKRLEAMDKKIKKQHRLDGFIVNHP